jgi:hypothetical protein
MPNKWMRACHLLLLSRRSDIIHIGSGYYSHWFWRLGFSFQSSTGFAERWEIKPDPINAAANSLTCYPAKRG